jgi:hypothetical protein
MHLARWLIASAVVATLAAPLPGCRRYIEKPVTALDAAGGRGGTGGSSGTSGIGGNDSGNTPQLDAPNQPPPDSRPPDRMPTDAIPPDVLTEMCGQSGQRCCPGNRCANNGCCAHGMCTPAFEMCPGEAASCLTTTCGSICGGLRENCCDPRDAGGYCVRELTVCVRTDAGSKCESCGITGAPCCRENYCETGRCMAGRCM